MKKRIPLLICLLICLVVLAGCSCEHTWTEADCVTAKTCSDCGETEGRPLGHTWTNATCEIPRTCTVCAATEGEAQGHSWADATCEAPRICTVCAAVEGDALGHSWVDATCETPKTCTACATTEGELLPHTFEISEYTVIDGDPIQTSTCRVCGLQETLEGEDLVNDILSSGVWCFLTARFLGEEINSSELCYMTFKDRNTFTFVLSDKLELKGTWTLYGSYEERGTVTHSLLLVWQDGGTVNALQYTDPDTKWEVFVIRDPDKNYLSFFKIDHPGSFGETG